MTIRFQQNVSLVHQTVRFSGGKCCEKVMHDCCIGNQQKHITPEIPLVCLEPCSGFLADAAVQSEGRKIILPKYGIREFEAKTFELATLVHVCIQPKEIVSWHKR